LNLFDDPHREECVRQLPTHPTTTGVVIGEILSSARRHGISDDDLRHGLNNAVAAIITPDQPDFTMIVGTDLKRTAAGRRRSRR
jgi:hypothetical protein